MDSMHNMPRVCLTDTAQFDDTVLATAIIIWMASDVFQPEAVHMHGDLPELRLHAVRL